MDEMEAYLADFEITRRPARTVQSKRKYLGDFVGLIGKKFADEYRREDVLKYKNKLQDKGFEPKTIDTRMMAVVTFFNRWLKIKLGLDAKDWPERTRTTPSRTPNDEATKLEAASAGEINLFDTYIQTDGVPRHEIAHLNYTDLLIRRRFTFAKSRAVIARIAARGEMYGVPRPRRARARFQSAMRSLPN